MQSFNYTITDEAGIHARPAGMLVKEAGKYNAQVMVKHGEKEADARKLFALMQLGIKKGDEVQVTVTGDDEDAVVVQMEQFFNENI
jgi:Phosphotransferase System HPr (HPr) Family